MDIYNRFTYSLTTNTVWFVFIYEQYTWKIVSIFYYKTSNSILNTF